MRRYSMMLIIPVTIALLNGCNEDLTVIPKITYRLPKVSPIKVILEPSGGVSAENLKPIYRGIKSLREKEAYYDAEATPLNNPKPTTRIW